MNVHKCVYGERERDREKEREIKSKLNTASFVHLRICNINLGKSPIVNISKYEVSNYTMESSIILKVSNVIN